MPECVGRSSTAALLAPHIFLWVSRLKVSLSQECSCWVCRVSLVSRPVTEHVLGQTRSWAAGKTGWGPVPGMYVMLVDTSAYKLMSENVREMREIGYSRN